MPLHTVTKRPYDTAVVPRITTTPHFLVCIDCRWAYVSGYLWKLYPRYSVLMQTARLLISHNDPHSRPDGANRIIFVLIYSVSEHFHTVSAEQIIYYQDINVCFCIFTEQDRSTALEIITGRRWQNTGKSAFVMNVTCEDISIRWRTH